MHQSQQQQQHSVQVRIVRKLRWHETSAETPNTCSLRDGICTASEADGSVFQLQDAETHPREGVPFILTILTGVSSKSISQTKQEQQQNSTVVVNTCIAAAAEQRQNSGRSSRSITLCTREAAPGTSVEEAEPGGARGGKA